MVLAGEVGGRWSDQTQAFLRQFAKAKSSVGTGCKGSVALPSLLGITATSEPLHYGAILFLFVMCSQQCLSLRCQKNNAPCLHRFRTIFARSLHPFCTHTIFILFWCTLWCSLCARFCDFVVLLLQTCCTLVAPLVERYWHRSCVLSSSEIDFGQFEPALFFDFGQFRLRPILTSANSITANF